MIVRQYIIIDNIFQARHIKESADEFCKRDYTNHGLFYGVFYSLRISQTCLLCELVSLTHTSDLQTATQVSDFTTVLPPPSDASCSFVLSLQQIDL